MLSYLEELKPDFEIVTDPRDRYEMLIDIGKELDSFPDSEKKEENKVHGCVSGVYVSIVKKDTVVQIKGFSESMIVRGYVKILIEALKGMTAKQILKAEKKIEEFIEETGISQSLVATRANAFGNIYSLIKTKVAALD